LKPSDLELILCKSIDFVIPNDRLPASIKALAQVKRLSSCPCGEFCPSNPEERYTPPPAFHLHVDTSNVTMGLYLQSETLWFLPPIDDSLSSPQKLNLPPYFALASDQTVLPPWRPGYGSGVFKPGEDLVIVPQPFILLEAFMRIYARDQGKRVGSFAMAMIAYIQLYVDQDGYLDATQLVEPFKTFYEDLKEGKKPVRQWTMELKEALGIPDEEPWDHRGW
jgi:hypothetical protein